MKKLFKTKKNKYDSVYDVDPEDDTDLKHDDEIYEDETERETHENISNIPKVPKSVICGEETNMEFNEVEKKPKSKIVKQFMKDSKNKNVRTLNVANQKKITKTSAVFYTLPEPSNKELKEIESKTDEIYDECDDFVEDREDLVFGNSDFCKKEAQKYAEILNESSDDAVQCNYHMNTRSSKSGNTLQYFRKKIRGINLRGMLNHQTKKNIKKESEHNTEKGFKEDNDIINYIDPNTNENYDEADKIGSELMLKCYKSHKDIRSSINYINQQIELLEQKRNIIISQLEIKNDRNKTINETVDDNIYETEENVESDVIDNEFTRTILRYNKRLSTYENNKEKEFSESNQGVNNGKFTNETFLKKLLNSPSESRKNTKNVFQKTEETNDDICPNWEDEKEIYDEHDDINVVPLDNIDSSSNGSKEDQMKNKNKLFSQKKCNLKEEITDEKQSLNLIEKNISNFKKAMQLLKLNIKASYMQFKGLESKLANDNVNQNIDNVNELCATDKEENASPTSSLHSNSAENDFFNFINSQDNIFIPVKKRVAIYEAFIAE